MANGITWRVEKNNLGEIQGQIRGATYDEVKEQTDMVLTDVQRRMHIPGQGRIYIRGGHTHQASAPGQAPAADTGGVIASYETGVAWEGDNAVGIIHSDHPASAALEYGAPARNLAPRPALVPAGEAVRKRIAGSLIARIKARIGLR
jgi:hypothetical protein